MYPSIDNDFNIKFIRQLMKHDIEVDYINFYENLSDAYKKELEGNHNKILLIYKSRIKYRNLRRFINLIKATLYIVIQVVRKYECYNYIFVVDYKLNLLVYFLELFFKRRSKRFYILQELYQYSSRILILDDIKLWLDKYSQKNAVIVINRNDLRKHYVDKINPTIDKRHLVIMDSVSEFLYISNRSDIFSELKLFYAGSIRNDFLDFILLLCSPLKESQINFRLILYGLDNGQIEYWRAKIMRECGSLIDYVSLNPRVENNRIIDELKKVHYGIIYYPKGKNASINEKLAAPCKLFEYLSVGVPIISYGSDYASYLIKKHNIGISIENIKDLKDLPSRLLSSYTIYLDNIKRIRDNQLYLFDREFERIIPYLT